MKAFITGATSGIGYELIKHLSKDGYDIFIVGRNVEMLSKMKSELESKYNIHVETGAFDLSKLEQVDTLCDKVKDMDFDLFFNNAGFDYAGEFSKVSYDNITEMINVNALAATKLMYVVLNKMLKKNAGKIINTCSLLGFVACPNAAVYSAAKSFILSITEAVNYEIKDTNVKVLALCPGATKTKFGSRANLDEIVFNKTAMNPEVVARLAYKKQVLGNKKVLITGRLNNLIRFAIIFAPNWYKLKSFGEAMKSNN